jgi:hypothetical protein
MQTDTQRDMRMLFAGSICVYVHVPNFSHEKYVQFGFVQHTVITLPNYHGAQGTPAYINDLLLRINNLIRAHMFTRTLVSQSVS